MTKPTMPPCAFFARRPTNAPNDLVETDEGLARAMKFIETHENPFDRLNVLCWAAERIKAALRKRELRIRRLTARIENSRGDGSETNRNEIANARRLIASIKSASAPYNTRLDTVLDLFASIRKDVLDGLLTYTEDFASSIPDGCQGTRRPPTAMTLHPPSADLWTSTSPSRIRASPASGVRRVKARKAAHLLDAKLLVLVRPDRGLNLL